MAQRHTIYAIELEGSSPLKLGALASGSHDISYTDLAPDSGGPYVEVNFIQEINEQIRASTSAISSLIDNLSLVQSTCLETGETFTAVAAFGRALDTCGTDGTKAGTTHARVRSEKSRVFVTDISVSGAGEVSANLQVQLLSADGDADASTTVYNVAMPTGITVDESYKLHGVTLAGISLDSDHITQLTINTGITYTAEFGVKTRPQSVTVTKTAPTITVDTEDTSILDAAKFPKNGKQMTHANSTIEFRKRDPATGGEVAAATTEHVKLTVAGQIKPTQPLSGTGSNKATAQLTGVLTGSLGSPPIVATTGVALTL